MWFTIYQFKCFSVICLTVVVKKKHLVNIIWCVHCIVDCTAVRRVGSSHIQDNGWLLLIIPVHQTLLLNRILTQCSFLTQAKLRKLKLTINNSINFQDPRRHSVLFPYGRFERRDIFVFFLFASDHCYVSTTNKIGSTI